MSLDKNRKIHIVDTTLRDGSHAVSHSYTVEQVTAIASGLDKVGVDIIELSHGDGLAGSSINYGFSATPEMELIRAASQVVRRARLGVLLLPGVGTIEDLKEARANGAQVVRVATHVTEADIAIQHLKAARELGMMPVGFLMMAHMAPPEKILEQAQIFVDAGAEYVNIADSAGYMTPDDVRARISLLVEKLPIPVGFHAHNNLGLAVANAPDWWRAARITHATWAGGGARAPGMPRQRWWPWYSSGWATRPAWTSTAIWIWRKTWWSLSCSGRRSSRARRSCWAMRACIPAFCCIPTVPQKNFT